MVAVPGSKSASYSLYKMRTVDTDGVAWSICLCMFLCVCLSVGHVRKSCRNG